MYLPFTGKMNRFSPLLQFGNLRLNISDPPGFGGFGSSYNRFCFKMPKTKWQQKFWVTGELKFPAVHYTTQKPLSLFFRRADTSHTLSLRGLWKSDSWTRATDFFQCTPGAVQPPARGLPTFLSAQGSPAMPGAIRCIKIFPFPLQGDEVKTHEWLFLPHLWAHLFLKPCSGTSVASPLQSLHVRHHMFLKSCIYYLHFLQCPHWWFYKHNQKTATESCDKA